MPEDVDRAPAVAGDALGDSDDVLELALDGIGEGVARGAPAAPIERIQVEVVGETRRERAERGVVGARAVDEQQRRAVGPSGAEGRDGRPVGSVDAGRLGLAHGRQA